MKKEFKPISNPIYLKKGLPELIRLMNSSAKLPENVQDANIFRFGGYWSRLIKELGEEEANNFLFATLGLGMFIEKNELFENKKTKTKPELTMFG